MNRKVKVLAVFTVALTIGITGFVAGAAYAANVDRLYLAQDNITKAIALVDASAIPGAPKQYDNSRSAAIRLLNRAQSEVQAAAAIGASLP